MKLLTYFLGSFYIMRSIFRGSYILTDYLFKNNIINLSPSKYERINECLNCDKIEDFLGKKRCQVCLCFIEAKASLIDQDCPHPNGSKWQKNK